MSIQVRTLMVVAAWVMAVAIAGPVAFAGEAAGGPIQFNRDVRPILSSKCFACHGIDAKKRKADLRLDVAESALAVRKKGSAVVAGDVSKSLLWSRVNSADPDEVMPPPDTHKS